MTEFRWFTFGAVTALLAVFTAVWWGIRVGSSPEPVERLSRPFVLPRRLP